MQPRPLLFTLMGEINTLCAARTTPTPLGGPTPHGPAPLQSSDTRRPPTRGDPGGVSAARGWGLGLASGGDAAGGSMGGGVWRLARSAAPSVVEGGGGWVGWGVVGGGVRGGRALRMVESVWRTMRVV